MWRTAERLLAAVLLTGTVVLSGCTITPAYEYGGDGDGADNGYVKPRAMDPAGIRDAVPRHEPRSRYGNPASYVVHGRSYRVMADSHGFVERGVASWYGPNFHGKRTSSGEPYDMYKMTAAHKQLPLPTYLLVTNLDNGRQAVVRVNDRGPFAHGRIIDLSYAAAVKLGVVRRGTANVEIRAIEPGRPLPQVAQQPPAPRPAPPATAPGSDGNIYLQAGAFSSELNARQLHSRLRDAIDPLITVNTSADPARPLYRVRLGPLQSMEQAMSLAHRLARLGVSGARVVID